MNWLNYFRKNQENRFTCEQISKIKVPREMRRAFVKSLQKFQVGESGEGNHLRQQAATVGDEDYSLTIDLFIKEEQEHARLMAQVLRNLRAPLISKHWSDQCFILLRRLFRLDEELLVLLMPEMIAKCYFRALRDGLENPSLKSTFNQILKDEEGHLAFHTHHLNNTFKTRSFQRRMFTHVTWRALFRLVCVIVLMDHGTLLRHVGLSRKAFWNECGEIFDEVAAGIFSPAHMLRTPNFNQASTGHPA